MKNFHDLNDINQVAKGERTSGLNTFRILREPRHYDISSRGGRKVREIRAGHCKEVNVK